MALYWYNRSVVSVDSVKKTTSIEDVPNDHEVALGQQRQQLQSLQSNWQRLWCRQRLPRTICVHRQLWHHTSNTQSHHPRRGSRYCSPIRGAKPLAQGRLGPRKHGGNNRRGRRKPIGGSVGPVGLREEWRLMRWWVFWHAVGRAERLDDLTDF